MDDKFDLFASFELSDTIVESLDKNMSNIFSNHLYGLCLLFIHANEKKNNKIYQKDLEKEFSIKSSTASDILYYLEKENYIVRTTSCNDSRYKELSLTNKANNMIVDIKRIINKTVMTLTKDISEEDKKTFFKVINKIIENGKKEENYGKHFKV